jgi:hypothetical protein
MNAVKSEVGVLTAVLPVSALLAVAYIFSQLKITSANNDYVVLDRHTHNTFTGTTILL